MTEREAELQRRQARSAAAKVVEVEARAAKSGRSAEVVGDLVAIREQVEQLAADVESR